LAIAASAMVFVGFLVWLTISVVAAVNRATLFMDRTERMLEESVMEVNQSLRSLRRAIDDIDGVVDGVRSFTDSVKGIGEEGRRLSASVKNLADIVQDLVLDTTASIRGVRAGFKTGFQVLIRNLLSGQSR
jgi:uncharacterized protein YoxC